MTGLGAPGQRILCDCRGQGIRGGRHKGWSSIFIISTEGNDDSSHASELTEEHRTTTTTSTDKGYQFGRGTRGRVRGRRAWLAMTLREIWWSLSTYMQSKGSAKINRKLMPVHLIHRYKVNLSHYHTKTSNMREYKNVTIPGMISENDIDNMANTYCSR